MDVDPARQLRRGRGVALRCATGYAAEAQGLVLVFFAKDLDICLVMPGSWTGDQWRKMRMCSSRVLLDGRAAAKQSDVLSTGRGFY